MCKRPLRVLAQAGPDQPALHTHLMGLYHVAQRPCPVQFAFAHAVSSARSAVSRGRNLSNAEDRASQLTVKASPEPPQITTPSAPVCACARGHKYTNKSVQEALHQAAAESSAFTDGAHQEMQER
eukprot:COSAG02_NODE_4932_length_4819_cov_3.269915_4_plen_125_part_00